MQGVLTLRGVLPLKLGSGFVRTSRLKSAFAFAAWLRGRWFLDASAR